MEAIIVSRSARRHRIMTLIGVVTPFAGLVIAVCCLWGWAFTWVELSLLLVMYTACGLGVTVGYHRLFTHRAFQTVRPVAFVLGVLGSMSVQGPLLRWVAVHRSHHQHSDQENDPHSPHGRGEGIRGLIAGFWHAHIGWIFADDDSNLSRHARDLGRSRMAMVISRLFGVWVFLGLVIPTVAGGLITGTWRGAVLGFLWGGLVRVFLGHHVTWSINSVCHLWGERRFATSDQSRNNLLFGMLALGEGWHNNHHAFPASARHGLRWWEFDLSYLTIQLLKLFGLAWGVRQPAAEVIRRRSAA